jgi:hypothetical protein
VRKKSISFTSKSSLDGLMGYFSVANGSTADFLAEPCLKSNPELFGELVKAHYSREKTLWPLQNHSPEDISRIKGFFKRQAENFHGRFFAEFSESRRSYWKVWIRENYH